MLSYTYQSVGWLNVPEIT